MSGGLVNIAYTITENGRLALDKISMAFNVKLKITNPSIVIIEIIVSVFAFPNISSAIG